jgi:N-acetylmuramoyl-L-alanine amidase
MKVRDHRLRNDDGTVVPFENTPNKGGKLKGGKPKFIIIHYTAGGSARSAINTFKNDANDVSAHLVIGHDGDITQMGKFDERLFHAGASKWKGISGLNSHSVGIEIANWGKLTEGPTGWKSWAGTAISDDRVILAEHRNFPGATHGWEIFDEAQIAATAAAVSAIAKEYGLGADAVLGHDDISPTRKVDPGPAWDMDRFRAHVFGRAEEGEEEAPVFKVIADSGLNMRDGPSVEHAKIKKLAKGAKVAKIDSSGVWWFVAEIVGGAEDQTGWVHSRWLEMA